MAIWGNEIKKGKVNDIFCSTQADVTDLPAFATKHDLKPGSTCLCIGTGQNSTVYTMNDESSWVQL